VLFASLVAVAGATSNADLNQQLQKLEGPVLGPADIAQPLARRPGEPRTLLQELQSTWRRSRFGGSGRRHPGSWG
jgi:hypothetical protein